MLENDRMETASKALTSIRGQNDIEKSTWRTHRYFVDFESGIHVKISTSNRCQNFHVDSPSKSMKSRRTLNVEFRCRINGESTKMYKGLMRIYCEIKCFLCSIRLDFHNICHIKFTFTKIFSSRNL